MRPPEIVMPEARDKILKAMAACVAWVFRLRRDGAGVLYTSLSCEGSLAEVSFH